MELGAAIGRYVLMPDHLHLFVRITPEIRLSSWASGLKRCVTMVLREAGEMPVQLSGRKLASFWQPGFFDHMLRRDESYGEKWDYVFQNPVRAGLVDDADAWRFQGEIARIDRA